VVVVKREARSNRHMKVLDICLMRVRVEVFAGGRCLWLPDEWRKGGREIGFVAGQFDELTYDDGPIAFTEEVKRGRVRLRRPRVEVLSE
jgi:hypothetical protein